MQFDRERNLDLAADSANQGHAVGLSLTPRDGVRRYPVDVEFKCARAGVLYELGVVHPAGLGGPIEAGDHGDIDRRPRPRD